MPATRAGTGVACANAGNADAATVILGHRTGNPSNLLGNLGSAFYNAVLSLGFNNGTVEELFRHRLSTLLSLIQLPESNIDKLAKNIPSSLSPSATNDIWFPTITCTNLC